MYVPQLMASTLGLFLSIEAGQFRGTVLVFGEAKCQALVPTTRNDGGSSSSELRVRDDRPHLEHTLYPLSCEDSLAVSSKKPITMP